MMKFPEKMFNATSAAIIIFNAEDQIVWVNDAFERNLGYNLDRINKISRWPFLTAKHQSKFSSIIKKAFSGNPPEYFDAPVVCSDAVIKTIRWITMLIQEEPGQKRVAALGVPVESRESDWVSISASAEPLHVLQNMK